MNNLDEINLATFQTLETFLDCYKDKRSFESIENYRLSLKVLLLQKINAYFLLDDTLSVELKKMILEREMKDHIEHLYENRDENNDFNGQSFFDTTFDDFDADEESMENAIKSCDLFVHCVLEHTPSKTVKTILHELKEDEPLEYIKLPFLLGVFSQQQLLFPDEYNCDLNGEDIDLTLFFEDHLENFVKAAWEALPKYSSFWDKKEHPLFNIYEDFTHSLEKAHVLVKNMEKFTVDPAVKPPSLKRKP